MENGYFSSCCPKTASRTLLEASKCIWKGRSHFSPCKIRAIMSYSLMHSNGFWHSSVQLNSTSFVSRENMGEANLLKSLINLL